MSDAAVTVPAAARPAGLMPLVQSLIINLLGPYIVFSLAEPHFPANSTMPLLLSALVPAIEFAILYWRQRVVDVIAIISLVQLVCSIVITLLAHTAHAAIIGQALIHAVLGLVFGVSVLIGTPLTIALARQTMAGNDRERQARFDAVAALDGARRVFARLAWVWTVTLVLNSAILLAAAHLLANRNYVLVSPIVTYGILGILIWGSIRYGRHAARKAAGFNGSTPALRQ